MNDSGTPDPVESEERVRRAALANMRQSLLAPAGALKGYSELLAEEVAASGADDLQDDIARIVDAAGMLTNLVNNLLESQATEGSLGSDEIEQIERKLRHDLRTPINAIKGYGEMLLEDAEDLALTSVQRDLEKLLTEADRLLGEIDAIVSFHQEQQPTEAGRGESESASMMVDLIDSITAVEESSLRDETGRILVVDDIEANRDLLARRLSRDGHSVETAQDGLAALQALREQPFDLVLLDLMMPGMNGYDVLKTMKSDTALRHIPVIMISALNETDSVLRCIEAGAQDYLLKPFDPVLLKARIGAGLESKQWTDDERRQRDFIRKAFSRFISPGVVDQLMTNPERLSLGGERLDITCVFTDLAGFTALIEDSEPTRVLPALNQYLDGLCRIVLEHEGTIDKIVGDALHAFFGAPLPQPDHPERAMRCVLELDRYARSFVETGEGSALGFGATRIGVHSGPAVVGNFGGDAFFDYTAHGDVINTAARMESVNKQLGTTICVSAATASRCPELDFRPVGTLVLKGKSEGIEAFELVDSDFAASVCYRAYLEAYMLLDSDPQGAKEKFDALTTRFATDPLIQWHHDRLTRGETGSRVRLDAK